VRLVERDSSIHAVHLKLEVKRSAYGAFICEMESFHIARTVLVSSSSECTSPSRILACFTERGRADPLKVAQCKTSKHFRPNDGAYDHRVAAANCRGFYPSSELRAIIEHFAVQN